MNDKATNSRETKDGASKSDPDPPEQIMPSKHAPSPPTEVPEGCWVINDGTELRIGASSASLGRAACFLFAFLFWNAIVGIFVSLLVHETIRTSGGTPPTWTRPWIPGSGPMPLAAVIVGWVVMSPFILGAVVIFMSLAMQIAGRVEVTLRAGRGELFCGVGPIGRTRRFDASKVRSVGLHPMKVRDENGNLTGDYELQLDAERPLRFGSQLRLRKQVFLQQALTDALAP